MQQWRLLGGFLILIIKVTGEETILHRASNASDKPALLEPHLQRNLYTLGDRANRWYFNSNLNILKNTQEFPVIIDSGYEYSYEDPYAYANSYFPDSKYYYQQSGTMSSEESMDKLTPAHKPKNPYAVTTPKTKQTSEESYSSQGQGSNESHGDSYDWNKSTYEDISSHEVRKPGKSTKPPENKVTSKNSGEGEHTPDKGSSGSSESAWDTSYESYHSSTEVNKKSETTTKSPSQPYSNKHSTRMTKPPYPEKTTKYSEEGGNSHDEGSSEGKYSNRDSSNESDPSQPDGGKSQSDKSSDTKDSYQDASNESSSSQYHGSSEGSQESKTTTESPSQPYSTKYSTQSTKPPHPEKSPKYSGEGEQSHSDGSSEGKYSHEDTSNESSPSQYHSSSEGKDEPKTTTEPPPHPYPTKHSSQPTKPTYPEKTTKYGGEGGQSHSEGSSEGKDSQKDSSNDSDLSRPQGGNSQSDKSSYTTDSHEDGSYTSHSSLYHSSSEGIKDSKTTQKPNPHPYPTKNSQLTKLPYPKKTTKYGTIGGYSQSDGSSEGKDSHGDSSKEGDPFQSYGGNSQGDNSLNTKDSHEDGYHEGSSSHYHSSSEGSNESKITTKTYQHQYSTKHSLRPTKPPHPEKINKYGGEGGDSLSDGSSEGKDSHRDSSNESDSNQSDHGYSLGEGSSKTKDSHRDSSDDSSLLHYHRSSEDIEDPKKSKKPPSYLHSTKPLPQSTKPSYPKQTTKYEGEGEHSHGDGPSDNKDSHRDSSNDSNEFNNYISSDGSNENSGKPPSYPRPTIPSLGPPKQPYKKKTTKYGGAGGHSQIDRPSESKASHGDGSNEGHSLESHGGYSHGDGSLDNKDSLGYSSNEIDASHYHKSSDRSNEPKKSKKPPSYLQPTKPSNRPPKPPYKKKTTKYGGAGGHSQIDRPSESKASHGDGSDEGHSLESHGGYSHGGGSLENKDSLGYSSNEIDASHYHKSSDRSNEPKKSKKPPLYPQKTKPSNQPSKPPYKKKTTKYGGAGGHSQIDRPSESKASHGDGSNEGHSLESHGGYSHGDGSLDNKDSLGYSSNEIDASHYHKSSDRSNEPKKSKKPPSYPQKTKPSNRPPKPPYKKKTTKYGGAGGHSQIDRPSESKASHGDGSNEGHSLESHGGYSHGDGSLDNKDSLGYSSNEIDASHYHKSSDRSNEPKKSKKPPLYPQPAKPSNRPPKPPYKKKTTKYGGAGGHSQIDRPSESKASHGDGSDEGHSLESHGGYSHGDGSLDNKDSPGYSSNEIDASHYHKSSDRSNEPKKSKKPPSYPQPTKPSNRPPKPPYKKKTSKYGGAGGHSQIDRPSESKASHGDGSDEGHSLESHGGYSHGGGSLENKDSLGYSSNEIDASHYHKSSDRSNEPKKSKKPPLYPQKTKPSNRPPKPPYKKKTTKYGGAGGHSQIDRPSESKASHGDGSNEGHSLESHGGYSHGDGSLDNKDSLGYSSNEIDASHYHKSSDRSNEPKKSKKPPSYPQKTKPSNRPPKPPYKKKTTKYGGAGGHSQIDRPSESKASHEDGSDEGHSLESHGGYSHGDGSLDNKDSLGYSSNEIDASHYHKSSDRSNEPKKSKKPPSYPQKTKPSNRPPKLPYKKKTSKYGGAGGHSQINRPSESKASHEDGSDEGHSLQSHGGYSHGDESLNNKDSLGYSSNEFDGRHSSEETTGSKKPTKSSEYPYKRKPKPYPQPTKNTVRVTNKPVENQLKPSLKPSSEEEDQISKRTCITHPSIKERQYRYHDSLPIEDWRYHMEKCSDPKKQCSCPYHPYRTLDGTCNNLVHPNSGTIETPFSRVASARYCDGRSKPRRSEVDHKPLPSSRKVTSYIFNSKPYKHKHATQLAAIFWIFVTEDIFMVKEREGIYSHHCCARANKMIPEEDLPKTCLPIEISNKDPFFSKYNQQCMHYERSKTANTCGKEKNNNDSIDQLNMKTSYLDLSPIYGSSEKECDKLRTHRRGQLRTKGVHYEGHPKWRRPFLPNVKDARKECGAKFKDDPCYLSGSSRVNKMITLAALHTLFVRQHNAIAQRLEEMNQSWDDEDLFQQTRKIMIAIYQNIIYNEWLPSLLGKETWKRFKLPFNKLSSDYDHQMNVGGISDLASTGLSLSGTLISSIVSLMNEKRIETADRDLFTSMSDLYVLESGTNLDSILRGLTAQPAQAFDQSFDQEFLNLEVEAKNGKLSGMDQLAYDIQRGRDMGITTYNDARVLCGLKRAEEFDEYHNTLHKKSKQYLRRVYSRPNDVDLLVGLLLEVPYDGGILGPIGSCLFGEQFARLRLGDRFFANAKGFKHSFSKDQLNSILAVTFSTIVCDTSDSVSYMQPDAFRQLSSENPLRKCSHIPELDLRQWKYIKLPSTECNY